jgi:hypothetical protein
MMMDFDLDETLKNLEQREAETDQKSQELDLRAPLFLLPVRRPCSDVIISAREFEQLYTEEQFRYNSNSIFTDLMGSNPFNINYSDGELMTPLVEEISPDEEADMYSKLRVVGINCIIDSLKPNVLRKLCDSQTNFNAIRRTLFNNSCTQKIYKTMIQPLYWSNFDFNLLVGHLKVIKIILELQATIIVYISQESARLLKQGQRSQGMTKP